jgi:ribosomal protein S27AE
VQQTTCPRCGATLLARFAGRLVASHLEGGACPMCGASLPGRFATAPGLAVGCHTALEEELA